MHIIIPNRHQPGGVTNTIEGEYLIVYTQQWNFLRPEVFAFAIFGNREASLSPASIVLAENIQDTLRNAMREHTHVFLVATMDDIERLGLVLDLQDLVTSPNSDYIKWRVA